MGEKRFRIIICFSLVLALAGSVLLLGRLVKPVWDDDPLWEPATDIVRGFYAEEEQSLDVLFLGSSHVFCGVNPLAIYAETGLKSYDLASGMQRAWMSYHYLVEALKTQSPAVVVLETSMLTADRPNEEARDRMAIDYMKPSANKWAAAKAAMEGREDQSLLSWYLPLFRFHDRILELERADFAAALSLRPERNPWHGYRHAYMDAVTPVEPLDYDAAGAGPVELWAEDSRALAYLRQIVALCRAEGIELVLLSTPAAGDWSGEESAAMSAFGAENGLVYLDHAAAAAELGLDGACHFYDATHLNVAGAEIYSRQLGAWLLENCFGGERPAPDPLWEADLAAMYP